MGKKIVIELDIEQGAAIKDLDAVKKGFQKVIDEQDKQIEATKESTKASSELGDKLDGVTGGAVTKFKSLVGGIKNSVTSLKAMRVALIATGIGAFVVAIGTLVANLQNSEEGFNRVNKLMKQLGVVAGNVTDIFYNLGTALFALLSGDMDLMNESFEKATNQIKNFGEETKREIALQGELSDKQAELVKIERSLILQRAEANRDRADLLEKAADRENYTASQRVAFLKEAGRIEEEITNAEIKAAQLRLEIKEQSNSLSESSTEDLNEQKQLEADIIDLQTAKLTKQKEVTSQIIGALNEERAAEKLALQERQSEIGIFSEQQDAITSILDGAVTKRKKLQIGSDEDVASSLKGLLKTQEQVAGSSLKIEKLTTDQKLGLAQDTFGNLAAIAGEQSAVGKAAAIAQTTISTFQGAQSAFASLAGIPIVGPALGAVAAAAAVAGGIAQVKNITAVKTPSFGGQKTITNTPSPRATSAPQPPAFNVVGAGEGSQIAQALGEKDQQPVKAYVVSQDVTTAQSLDRNIIESASIG